MWKLLHAMANARASLMCRQHSHGRGAASAHIATNMLTDRPRADAALSALLADLKDRQYQFTTITPASHQRVLARHPGRTARDLKDVLGWSLPFNADEFPELTGRLRDAQMVDETPPFCRSRIRVSSLFGDLYLHSAFPTDAQDAVFFGPDSYRFGEAIVQELNRRPLEDGAYVLDIGTGAGVGGIVTAKRCPRACILATDVNADALRFAEINGRHAGVALEMYEADGVTRGGEMFDLILLNPPYIVDADNRTYRNGGGSHGAELALRLVKAALPRLRADGRLLLYMGSAIVRGYDALHTELAAASANFDLTYREIDPDVFGEELATPPYQSVDRIALVTAVIHKP